MFLGKKTKSLKIKVLRIYPFAIKLYRYRFPVRISILTCITIKKLIPIFFKKKTVSDNDIDS